MFGVAPPPRGSRAPVQVTFRDRSGYFTALWFGRGYLAQVFKRDQRVVLYGKKALAKDRRVVLEGPDFEIVEDDERPSRSTWAAWCPSTRSPRACSSAQVRTLLHRVVERPRGAGAGHPAGRAPPAAGASCPSPPPTGRCTSPTRPDDVEAARRRFAFEDFFVLQVGLTLRRARQARERGRPLAPPGALVERLRQGLPFTLTAAQERVWAEIRSDLARPVPMNRLLQGDVGSGKTIVAVMALLTAVEAGCQAVLMAPTEILAEQHLRTVRALVEPLGLAVAWLSAGQRAREREAALDALRTGNGRDRRRHPRPDPGRGRAPPARAGRRGRAASLRRAPARVASRKRGASPRARHDGDADPAHARADALRRPRRLVLDQLPPGRTPIRTDWRREPARERIYDFIRGELRAGRQAYVVCPLVEETEASDLKAATEMAERLQAGPFRDFRVGLVHGRLSFDAKDAVMRAFKAGELDVLVATTVIEVGIDVPNASVMLIEHAERFGLAQLHQLRGRVGRGVAQSYCILLVNEPMSDEARQRIDAMAKTQDGFRLAEVDLGIRGPGEFFGTRQSGLPEFRAASLVTHARLLEEARQDAEQLIAGDPGLRLPEHRALREALVARWRERLELASIG